MQYFSQTQIEEIKQQFPSPENRYQNPRKVELSSTQKKEYAPLTQDIVEAGIKNKKIHLTKVDSEMAKFYISFKSLDCYNQPEASAFWPVIEDVEIELSKAFGYRTVVILRAISFGQEPAEIPPLYFGEKDEPAVYEMCVKVCFDRIL